MDLFGIPGPLLFGQLLLGLINGAFYALLSLGLAVIFGMLNVINFTHGAQFMMGAFVAWMLLSLGTSPAAAIAMALMLLPCAMLVLEWALTRAGLRPSLRWAVLGAVAFAWLCSLLFSVADSPLAWARLLLPQASATLHALMALVGLALVVLLADEVMARIPLARTFRRGGMAAIAALWLLSMLFGVTGSPATIVAALLPNGLSYWWALLLSPLIVGCTGVIMERSMISRLYQLDHLYGLLLTFGAGLILEGLFRNEFGSSGLPYRIPPELSGAWDLGFMFMPVYRGWVVAVAFVMCLATWLIIEKTKIGSYLRAATENPSLVQAFGINVPRMMTLTYGAGVALAAFAGVLAAPIYSVNPQMGSNLIIIVFAVVVIGGMGSILGSVLTGFGLGVVEGLTKVFYPEGSSTVIFVVMAIVLLARPAGLFGRS